MVLAGVLLSSCGALHPGAAAVVGDKTISMSKVDQVAGDYCHAITKQLQGDSQVVPLNFFRGGVAGSLALRSAAEQLAAEYGVQPESVYDHKVTELQKATVNVPDQYQDAVIEVESTSAYVEGVQAAVGAAQDPKLGYIEAQKAGQSIFNDWLAQHEVTFDPSLGVTLQKGNIARQDGSLSYAVGSVARNGGAANPDHEYASALPSSHRCG
jgi:peptidyl-prolyl cis-trans isomerase SurA